jgi:hypothetical protein
VVPTPPPAAGPSPDVVHEERSHSGSSSPRLSPRPSPRETSPTTQHYRVDGAAQFLVFATALGVCTCLALPAPMSCALCGFLSEAS